MPNEKVAEAAPALRKGDYVRAHQVKALGLGQAESEVADAS